MSNSMNAHSMQFPKIVGGDPDAGSTTTYQNTKD